ncbi:hypothetical protein ACSBR2_035346 [Camellia fascicularis]
MEDMAPGFRFYPTEEELVSFYLQNKLQGRQDLDRTRERGPWRKITTSGYWKAIGSPGYVYSSRNRVIGMKKTMVFYRGRAPTGRKTEWKMNEYRAIEGEASSSSAIPKV